jgi:hypothetical protein
VSLPKTPFLLKRLKFQSRGVQVFAAGGLHDFDVKFVAPVRWKHAGRERQLSLLTVRPVAYRLRKRAPLSYRKPAYLIPTDPTLLPQRILQTYLWRSEMEVNFRDEKTLLGFGQPQVRSDPAVRTTASFFVFVYAPLLLNLENSYLAHSPWPRPRWQQLRPQRPHPVSSFRKPSRCCAPISGPPLWDCQIKTASLQWTPAQQSRS